MKKIKLIRKGRKHIPSYRIVISNAKSSPKSKYFEKIGFYNPIEKNFIIFFKTLLKNIKMGSIPTNSLKLVTLFYLKKIN